MIERGRDLAIDQNKERLGKRWDIRFSKNLMVKSTSQGMTWGGSYLNFMKLPNNNMSPTRTEMV